MTKTELNKLKELDAFLKEKNIRLRGENVSVKFNADNYYINCVQLDLDIGNGEDDHSEIIELYKNQTPRFKNHYYIKEGKLKQY